MDYFVLKCLYVRVSCGCKMHLEDCFPEKVVFMFDISV